MLRVTAETAAAIAAYPNHARARAAMPGRMSASAMEENPTSTTPLVAQAGLAQYFLVGYTATSAAAAAATSSSWLRPSRTRTSR